MGGGWKQKQKQQGVPEIVELGKVSHVCQGQLVVGLTSKGIPCPNSVVFDSCSKVIGKVDEILGRLNNVYMAVKLDDDRTYVDGEVLFVCARKLIPAWRFLPREEVERKKEKMDINKSKTSGNGKRDATHAGRREKSLNYGKKLDDSAGNKMNDKRSWGRKKRQFRAGSAGEDIPGKRKRKDYT